MKQEHTWDRKGSGRRKEWGGREGETSEMQDDSPIPQDEFDYVQQTYTNKEKKMFIIKFLWLMLWIFQ